jgi:hypothetical protein
LLERKKEEPFCQAFFREFIKFRSYKRSHRRSRWGGDWLTPVAIGENLNINKVHIQAPFEL